MSGKLDREGYFEDTVLQPDDEYRDPTDTTALESLIAKLPKDVQAIARLLATGMSKVDVAKRLADHLASAVTSFCGVPFSHLTNQNARNSWRQPVFGTTRCPTCEGVIASLEATTNGLPSVGYQMAAHRAFGTTGPCWRSRR